MSYYRKWLYLQFERYNPIINYNVLLSVEYQFKALLLTMNDY